MSRLVHFLDSRITDGGDVGPTRRQPFTPKKIPGTQFCWRLSGLQRHNAAGRIRSTEKSNDIGYRTRDHPANSTVPQPTTLPRAPGFSSFVSVLKNVLYFLCPNRSPYNLVTLFYSKDVTVTQ
jgi:hypothetical protein